MTTLLNWRCPHCGHDEVTPIIYGMRSPRKEFDLQLLGCIVVRSSLEKRPFQPLWACAYCEAINEQVGYRADENEQIIAKYYQTLNDLFTEYKPLSVIERNVLLGRDKLNRLISDAEEIGAQTCFLRCGRDGGTAEMLGEAPTKRFECDKQTCEHVAAYCSSEALRSNNNMILVKGSPWVLHSRHTDASLEITVKRVGAITEGGPPNPQADVRVRTDE